MPAANVENVFAPAPGDEVEQTLAPTELANSAGVEHKKAQTKEVSRTEQKQTCQKSAPRLTGPKAKRRWQ